MCLPSLPPPPSFGTSLGPKLPLGLRLGRPLRLLSALEETTAEAEGERLGADGSAVEGALGEARKPCTLGTPAAAGEGPGRGGGPRGPPAACEVVDAVGVLRSRGGRTGGVAVLRTGGVAVLRELLASAKLAEELLVPPGPPLRPPLLEAGGAG